jgi:hypothetical protein
LNSKGCFATNATRFNFSSAKAASGVSVRASSGPIHADHAGALCAESLPARPTAVPDPEDGKKLRMPRRIMTPEKSRAKWC